MSTLDINGGSDCSDAYLQIGDLGKFCSDSSPPASTVISASNLSLNFVTGTLVRGKGFQITLKSVGLYSLVFAHEVCLVAGCPTDTIDSLVLSFHHDLAANHAQVCFTSFILEAESSVSFCV